MEKAELEEHSVVYVQLVFRLLRPGGEAECWALVSRERRVGL
jgi:hypothetical protein